MAWNPSKEVAIARDAARQLGDARMCVVVWVSSDGEKLGMASYGRTKLLCDEAKAIGDKCYDETFKHISGE